MEIIFEPMKKSVSIQSVKTILDLAREAGIALRADCGGIGICGKCLVKILRVGGKLTPPTNNEVTALGMQRLNEGYRLSCQTKLLEGNVEVFIPPESLIQRYRSADVGLEKLVPLNPAVTFHRVLPKKPNLVDPQPDVSRILVELYEQGIDVDASPIPLELLRDIPEIVRKAEWDLNLILWNSRLIDVKPYDNSFKPIGVAVDIGTSKIVVHLIDLASGETLAVESTPNPQASYGADIISRLTYAIQSNENLAKLQRAVINAINILIKKASERTSIPLDWIYEVVVVGNTVMHHLFLGIKPKHLGFSPYTPATRGPHYFNAKELDIDINSKGVIYLPPVVAGFVGSDAIADAVAVGVDECEEPCALIDIGTNTEIIINTGKKIIAGSTPAGPAFEGATMSFGMRAIEGAIDQVFVYFDKSLSDYAVRYNVVGGKKPSGICGSGYIDLLANLYRLRLLNRRGKFAREIKSSRLIVENDLLRFVVAKAEETSIGRNIVVDEKDIDSLLLAKAAVASGFKMLLRYAGLESNDLSRVFVAGSFGSYINMENALTIGLLPNIPISRFIFVGNAAIVGAKAMLKSKEFREKASKIARAIEYVELAAQQEFSRIFMESLYLP
ncbi:MAG: ASKHA domain-containing protein [Ignisphaera sp.]